MSQIRHATSMAQLLALMPLVSDYVRICLSVYVYIHVCLFVCMHNKSNMTRDIDGTIPRSDVLDICLLKYIFKCASTCTCMSVCMYAQ